MRSDTERGETLLTITEVLERLKIKRTKLNEVIQSGTLPSVVIGTRRLVRQATLDEFIRSLEAGE